MKPKSNTYPVEPAKVLPNPNPANYKILRSQVVGKPPLESLVVEVLYPDCTNYEGRKILVYHRATVQELVEQGSIDPHFSNNPKMISPFARFEPTDWGWKMALELAKIL